MRKRRYLIFITIEVIIITILSITIYSCNNSATQKYTNKSAEAEIVIEAITGVVEEFNKSAEAEIVTGVITKAEEEPNFHSYMSCDWSSEDSYLLAKIAMAEAEGEDVEGKALVMMVILNRMLDDEFPDTIDGVIYQKVPNSDYHQFSPLDNGRFNRVEPNEECWEALEMIMMDKWDESKGALYFESCPNPYNWHSRNLEYLFTHGNHRFYK